MFAQPIQFGAYAVRFYIENAARGSYYGGPKAYANWTGKFLTDPDVAKILGVNSIPKQREYPDEFIALPKPDKLSFFRDSSVKQADFSGLFVIDFPHTLLNTAKAVSLIHKFFKMLGEGYTLSGTDDEVVTKARESINLVDTMQRLEKDGWVELPRITLTDRVPKP